MTHTTEAESKIASIEAQAKENGMGYPFAFGALKGEMIALALRADEGERAAVIARRLRVNGINAGDGLALLDAIAESFPRSYRYLNNGANVMELLDEACDALSYFCNELDAQATGEVDECGAHKASVEAGL